MWSEAPPVSVVDMRLRPGFGLDPKMARLCHALAADDVETGKLDKGLVSVESPLNQIHGS